MIFSPRLLGSPAGRTAVLTTLPPATGRGVVLTIPAPPIEKESSSEEPSDSESESEDKGAAAAIIEKLTHALRKRKKSSKSTSKRQKLTGSATEPQLFDPSLDKEDKDEYKFDVPEVIGQYLEQHFRKGLAKEERTAMLKRHPKPNTKVMTPPKLDHLFQTLHRRWTKQEMRH